MMEVFMVENLTEISKDQLLSVTQDMMYNKYRFITSDNKILKVL